MFDRTPLPSGFTSSRGSSGPNGLWMMATPTESFPTTVLPLMSTWSPPTFKTPVPVGSGPTSSPLSNGTGLGKLLCVTTLPSISVSSLTGIGSLGTRLTRMPTVLPTVLLSRTTECREFSVSTPIAHPLAWLFATATQESSPT